VEDPLRLAERLNKELDLAPYESQAYISLLTHGPMSPSEIARKSNIPRPRTYDVLRSLMEKGLLIEQSGKPSIYAAIEPSKGLANLLITIESESNRQLEEKRRATDLLASALSQLHERSKGIKFEKGKVWFTQRDAAFLSLYIEAIGNCEKELLVASKSLYAPEEEILRVVEGVLKKGITIRVVRDITRFWSSDELDRYEEIIKAGSQVRHLNVKEIPLRFMVFDRKDLILIFPSEFEPKKPRTTEALWLRIPPLAGILSKHFEELWSKSKPITPILKELKEEKQLEKARE